MTKHLEGLLFIPLGGQNRFGVKIDDENNVEFVKSGRNLDHWFPYSLRQITCHELCDDERGEDRKNVVLRAVDLHAQGTKYAARYNLEDGVYIILINRDRGAMAGFL